MEASERLQPMPKGPFPTAESYVSANRGPNRNRSGDVRIGIVIEPVPLTGFASNFSPRPRIAPPPFGSVIAGGEITKLLSLTASPLLPVENTWPTDDRSLVGFFDQRDCLG